jgi:tight adherence protein C
MTLLLVGSTFLFTVFLVLILGTALSYRRYQVSDRLSDIKKMAVEAEPEELLRLPFMQRVVVPVLSSMGHVLGNLTPGEIRTRMKKRILYAGTPGNITFPVLIAVQVLLGGAFLLLSVVLLRSMQVDVGRMVVISLLLTLFGLFLPYGVISNRGEARQKAIQRSLPDTLDLLQVSVEAGLGFDMALKRVTQQMKGPLSDEIKRALDEIRMGGSRDTALRGIARRTGVSDLSSFISAVIQAEELGGNISNTLRAQADFMRQKRRQKIEETAMKAPIKMIFPLLFFIFPALFVVILGPAAISIMQMFATIL